MRRLKGLIALLMVLVMSLSGFDCIAEALPGSDEIDFTLYYPSGNFSGLTAINKQLKPDKTKSIETALVEALLEKPDGMGILPLFGGEAKLRSVQDSFDIITFGIESYAASDERQRALSVLAIWQTLAPYTHAKGLNVIVDGSPVSYEGKGLNTLLFVKTNELGLEALLRLAGENRAYSVYIPEKSGMYVVPTLKPVPSDMTDEEALLRCLCPHEDETSLLCTWPQEFSLADGMRVTFSFTRQNRRIALLSYTEPQNAAMRINEAFRHTGMQQWQFVASVALTFLTNVPSLERVSMKLSDLQITNVIGAEGNELAFENGEIAGNVFFSRLAFPAVQLAWDEQSGKLTTQTLLVPVRDTQNGADLLLALLGDHLNKGDVLSVQCIGDTAFVDLSGEYYAKCQRLKAEEERTEVYLIVNALCMNRHVQKVCFTVEGRSIGTFAGTIRMDAPLKMNYGLLKENYGG